MKGVYKMSTPDYTKKAVANYRNKFDIQQLRMPKGTKEQITAKYGNISVNDYIVGLVLSDLQAHQEQPTEPTSDSLEDKPNPVHEIEDMEKLQEYLEQLRKDNEQRKQVERAVDKAKIENALEE